MPFNLAQMAREIGVRVNKVLPIIEPTQSIEDELYSIILPMVLAYRQQVGYIEDNWTAGAMTQSFVDAILTTAAASGIAQAVLAEPKVQAWTERVERWHRTRWSGVIKSSVRVDISPILSLGEVRTQVEAATKLNVSLIRGLSEELQKKMRATVWEAYGAGTTARPLAKTLREQFDFAPERARLIARDQLAKYADALDQARALEAGLEEYVWKTVGDDVVRPTHRANDGKRFRNDKPPPVTGHPGHDINCRCKRRQIVLTDAEEAQLVGL